MFIAVFLYLSSILFNASLLQNVSSHWLWICILFLMDTDNDHFSCEVSSFNALSGNSHAWESFSVWWTTRKRRLGTQFWLKPMKLLHFEENVIWKSPNTLQLYIIWLRTEYQYRKTTTRKWRKGDDREAKRNVTLHILNCRLTLFAWAGRRVIPDLVLSYWKLAAFVVIYTSLDGSSWNAYQG